MLNTFLIKHQTGIIQGLDDLVLTSTRRATPLFNISETRTLGAMSLDVIHEIVREVKSGYRQELQRLDDDIEALTTRREDMLTAAFEEGIKISTTDLETYIG